MLSRKVRRLKFIVRSKWYILRKIISGKTTLQLSTNVQCFRYLPPASNNFTFILLTGWLWSVRIVLVYFIRFSFFHLFILVILPCFYCTHFIKFLFSLHLIKIRVVHDLYGGSFIDDLQPLIGFSNTCVLRQLIHKQLCFSFLLAGM